ncbi:methanogen output domain 1-containing protein [Tepidamorphus sp. 3E244]|uniref:methanogen output domain 1-containing protein n=1 Tax=Tepidamorphus sp. 3E244 TaxID=3385498 RepID=UPI0038FC1B57
MTGDIGKHDVPLNKDLFLRKLLRELSGTLQDVVGMENASGYIAVVGSAMGKWIDEQYREAMHVSELDAKQVAQVFVDLKGRIGGDFYIIELDSEKIVVGNRACPFGEMANGRESLCQMTSNVFGRIAADNLGYARVSLDHTIATGHKQCRIVVYLKPEQNVEVDEREFYRVPK